MLKEKNILSSGVTVTICLRKKVQS